MTPVTHPDLFKVLNRIAAALEKLADKPSGGGGAAAGAGWRAMLVPKWAKYDAGKPFGDLNDKGLAFWVSGYVPKPFEKRDGTVVPPSAVDMRLRKALDEAAKELGMPLPPGYEPEGVQQGGDHAPFTPPAGAGTRPTPPPQDNIDEDVPF